MMQQPCWDTFFPYQQRSTSVKMVRSRDKAVEKTPTLQATVAGPVSHVRVVAQPVPPHEHQGSMRC